VMQLLKRHAWPGNIRELQNFIERAVIATPGRVLRTLAGEFCPRDAGVGPVRTLADAERAHITATLRETNWVVGGQNGAASRLGVPRTSLVSRMRRLGISRGNLGACVSQAGADARPTAAGFHREFTSPRFATASGG
jgi:formate hydrogenlyase transcriptional activator